MAGKNKFDSVVFIREDDTRRKARFSAPRDEDGRPMGPVQGLIYLAKDEVPAGMDLEVTVRFVEKED